VRANFAPIVHTTNMENKKGVSNGINSSNFIEHARSANVRLAISLYGRFHCAVLHVGSAFDLVVARHLLVVLPGLEQPLSLLLLRRWRPVGACEA